MVICGVFVLAGFGQLHRFINWEGSLLTQDQLALLYRNPYLALSIAEDTGLLILLTAWPAL
jgi:hypothetical protein